MNSTERLKEICRLRGIPLSRIERELGFSNGYFSSKKGELPPDRLKMVADYLGVSADFLLYGEERGVFYANEETAQIAQELHDNTELRMLFSAVRDADPQTLRDLHDMFLIMKRRETE